MPLLEQVSTLSGKHFYVSAFLFIYFLFAEIPKQASAELSLTERDHHKARSFQPCFAHLAGNVYWGRCHTLFSHVSLIGIE
jgi:hypothetical protein